MALNAFEGNAVNQDFDGQAFPTVTTFPNDGAKSVVAAAHQEFRNACSGTSSQSECLSAVAAILARFLDAQFVVHFEAHADGATQSYLVAEKELEQPDRDSFCKTCNQACMARSVVFESWHDQVLLAVPMDWVHNQCMLIALPDDSDVPQALTIVYDALAQVCLRDHSDRSDESHELTNQLAAITELVSKVESGGEPEVSAKTLVDELAEYFDCDVVAVGLYRGADSTCELMANSQTDAIDRNSQLSRDLQSVIYEAVARGETSHWPPLESESKHALRVHRFFVETSEFEAVLSIPLVTENDQPVGVLVLAGQSSVTRDDQTIRFLTTAQRPLAAALRLIQSTHRNRLLRLLEKAIHFWYTDPKSVVKNGLLCVLAASLIPAPYRVKCDCELQPILRRFVAAPFDGRLEEAFVEPGDVVKTDSVLAKMDGREILLELSEAEEKLHVASKQHAGYLAKHETGDAQIAAHEVERLRMQHKILQHREQNLNITSPIDGIVVEGDHKRSVGMPLQVGEPLFEIAPLEKMVVEISVPEEDIRFVKIDQKVSISLDAFSVDRFHGNLQKVHPKAELRNDENVFIAEINVQNAPKTLRPGMRGTARISTGWRPLGWNILHKPVAAAVEFLGW